MKTWKLETGSRQDKHSCLVLSMSAVWTSYKRTTFNWCTSSGRSHWRPNETNAHGNLLVPSSDCVSKMITSGTYSRLKARQVICNLKMCKTTSSATAETARVVTHKPYIAKNWATFLSLTVWNAMWCNVFICSAQNEQSSDALTRTTK